MGPLDQKVSITVSLLTLAHDPPGFSLYGVKNRKSMLMQTRTGCDAQGTPGRYGDLRRP